MKTRIDDELKRMFRPEFLNRIDAVVTFKSLTTEQVREIVDLMLARTSKHLAEQEVYLEVTTAAKDWLAKEGFDRIYGARPLRRVITQRIENPLSEQLLHHKFNKGDTILIDADENGVTLLPKPAAKQPAGSGAAEVKEG